MINLTQNEQAEYDKQIGIKTNMSFEFGIMEWLQTTEEDWNNATEKNNILINSGFFMLDDNTHDGYLITQNYENMYIQSYKNLDFSVIITDNTEYLIQLQNSFNGIDWTTYDIAGNSSNLVDIETIQPEMYNRFKITLYANSTYNTFDKLMLTLKINDYGITDNIISVGSLNKNLVQGTINNFKLGNIQIGFKGNLAGFKDFQMAVNHSKIDLKSPIYILIYSGFGSTDKHLIFKGILAENPIKYSMDSEGYTVTLLDFYSYLAQITNEDTFKINGSWDNNRTIYYYVKKMLYDSHIYDHRLVKPQENTGNYGFLTLDNLNLGNLEVLCPISISNYIWVLKYKKDDGTLFLDKSTKEDYNDNGNLNILNRILIDNNTNDIFSNDNISGTKWEVNPIKSSHNKAIYSIHLTNNIVKKTIIYILEFNWNGNYILHRKMTLNMKHFEYMVNTKDEDGRGDLILSGFWKNIKSKKIVGINGYAHQYSSWLNHVTHVTVELKYSDGTTVNIYDKTIDTDGHSGSFSPSGNLGPVSTWEIQSFHYPATGNKESHTWAISLKGDFKKIGNYVIKEVSNGHYAMMFETHIKDPNGYSFTTVYATKFYDYAGIDMQDIHVRYGPIDANVLTYSRRKFSCLLPNLESNYFLILHWTGLNYYKGHFFDLDFTYVFTTKDKTLEDTFNQDIELNSLSFTQNYFYIWGYKYSIRYWTPADQNSNYNLYTGQSIKEDRVFQKNHQVPYACCVYYKKGSDFYISASNTSIGNNPDIVDFYGGVNPLYAYVSNGEFHANHFFLYTANNGTYGVFDTIPITISDISKMASKNYFDIISIFASASNYYFGEIRGLIYFKDQQNQGTLELLRNKIINVNDSQIDKNYIINKITIKYKADLSGVWTKQDDESIEKYGTKELKLEFPFFFDTVYFDTIADKYLDRFSRPTYKVNMDIIYTPQAEIIDVGELDLPEIAFGAFSIILKLNHDYIGNKTNIELLMNESPDHSYWGLSEWGVATYG